MSDIGTFPTITDGIVQAGDNFQDYIAGEAITAGQLVGYPSVGTSDTIVPMDATIGETPVGVALYSVGSGEHVAVAGPGCEVTMVNADDTTAIDAGNSVVENDNSVKGTVSSAGGVGGIPAAGSLWIIGVAKEDIAGAATGVVTLGTPYHVPA